MPPEEVQTIRNSVAHEDEVFDDHVVGVLLQLIRADPRSQVVHAEAVGRRGRRAVLSGHGRADHVEGVVAALDPAGDPAEVLDIERAVAEQLLVSVVPDGEWGDHSRQTPLSHEKVEGEVCSEEERGRGGTGEASRHEHWRSARGVKGKSKSGQRGTLLCFVGLVKKRYLHYPARVFDRGRVA